MSARIDFEKHQLYLCIGLSDSLGDNVRAAIDGGIDVVQLRDKTAEAQPIISAAVKLLKITQAKNVPFFINDRVDIAYVVGSDGIHLGQGDINPSDARQMLGQDVIIGRSTHSTSECDRTVDEDIDYISAGPIEATPTKPGREPTGIAYLQYAIEKSKHPVFVTGGITPQKIDELAPLGVRHFVVVRYIVNANDAFKAATDLRKAIDRNIS